MPAAAAHRRAKPVSSCHARNGRPRSPVVGTATLAFLFTDIAGSTRLWEDLPGAMAAAIIHAEASGGLDPMISESNVDPTLDRLLRHMAWANAALIGQLAGLTDEALGLASPRNEWAVAMILQHLVDAAERYAARLEGIPRPDASEPPTTVAELTQLGARCAAIDARIRTQAAVPDGPSPSPNPGKVGRARSTVLGQAIHHATEHRAQIAGALATNGIDAIDLDAVDVWAYGDAEGLGA